MPDSALLNDIKMVLDISSRVDERVKIIQTIQQETHSRVNDLVREVSELSSRVAILESKNGGKVHQIEDLLREIEIRVERIEALKSNKDKVDGLEVRMARLEDSKDNWIGRVKHYTGLLVQGLWVIIVCYLLYKLGLNTSPLP